MGQMSATGSREGRPEPNGRGTTASRLLHQAAELFRRKGYSGSTTRELAAALGIQRASLYHHIRGKEDLLYDISIASLNNITEAVADAAASTPDDERLEAMIIAHLQAALDDRDMHTTMLTELRSLSDERRATVLARRDRYESLLRDAIRADQRAGRLRADIDARLLTLALLNLLNWTIFWYDPKGGMAPRELARALSTVFFDGTRARP